ncbi:T9SS type A sorting domain-containing protein, partial [Aquiflexum sp. TKW24L]|uniref:T9SS type A sorting domain-containing protein n=1 Tax=Aquiflexum sp. TKW24L TaxID=2942212 RepID=UPI0020BD4E85
AISQIQWTADGYDPLRPGFYQLNATIKNSGFEGRDVNFQVPVLVLNKPMPEDIVLANNVVSKKVRSGEIVGGLQTIDPVDDIHSYSMADHPDYYIEKGVVVYKGEGMPPLETTLRVSSTDRAGQTISREIKVFREMDAPNDAMIYPNPATTNTNIYIRMAQSSKVTIRIFDAAGRQIYEESGQQEGSFTRSLDISRYAAGMYQVIIQVDQHFINRRLVKE